MINEKYEILPTPPYNKIINCRLGETQQNNSHSEALAEESHKFRNPYGQTLTPTLSQRRRGKCAFTLAETLITLVIIGVIAAITVPTLITKYQKEQTVTRLKKAYSTLAQTTQKAISDNGPIETWEIGANANGASSINFFQKYLKPYLNISKDCGNTTSGSCQFNYSYLNNNTTAGSCGATYERFYLQDGTLIGLVITNNDDNKYVRIMVDINGQKGPNKFGKDIFRFNYSINAYGILGKLVPNCYSSTLEESLHSTSDGACNLNAETRAGFCCSNVIMRSSWKLPDDYPL